MNIEEIKQKAEKERVGVNLVFKEYMQTVVLVFLFRAGLFDYIVFQGGTAIRFFYGGVRYSDDLDFVLRNKKNNSIPDDIKRKMSGIGTFMEKNIPIVRKSEVKIQKESSLIQRYILISNIDMLNMVDRTRIEIGLVPSYTGQVHFLKTEYTPFPPAVVVEAPEEILADKVVAFGGRKYLKGRDVWDIYFLRGSVKINLIGKVKEMVDKKIDDYRIGKKEFKTVFKENLILLKKRGEKIVAEEMERYLPAGYKEMFKGQYFSICKDTFEFLSGMIK